MSDEDVMPYNVPKTQATSTTAIANGMLDDVTRQMPVYHANTNRSITTPIYGDDELLERVQNAVGENATSPVATVAINDDVP